ncbi:MAG: tryptophan synthase subunit alpha, partial [Lentisphaeria bacterium]|nr:tryptophan synthase subunit alpha [Lentisphaeria bacterium]
MDRLQKIFSSRQTALVIFDSCGAPTLEESERRLETIVANGADIVELGVPFSDPMADGPAIQRASLEALRQGTTLAHVLATARRLREKHPDTGIILFGYFNVFLQYGLERFAADAAAAGADGVLVVDLPFEERDEFLPLCRKHRLALIPLVAPGTDAERARQITRDATGFVYCVTARGVTGERSQLPPELAERLEILRRIAPVPVAAGFGIDGADSAAAVA